MLGTLVFIGLFEDLLKFLAAWACLKGLILLGILQLLLAPQVGLEPTTLRLTAECSAIELLRSDQAGNFATEVDFTANSMPRVNARSSLC
jgi:hypothetical protein